MLLRLKWLGILSLLVPLIPVHADTEWKEIHRDEGVVVYERKVDGSPLLAFKGSGIVEAPLERVAAIVLDADHANEWIDRLADAHVVRWRSPTEYVEYNHIATPFIVKDRDFVSLVKLTPEPFKNRFTARFKSTEDPLAPPTNYVRGEMMESVFELTSQEGGKKTLVEAELHTDPKGDIPKWVVNMIQRTWPTTTFEALRARVKSPDVKITPSVVELIHKLMRK